MDVPRRARQRRACRKALVVDDSGTDLETESKIPDSKSDGFYLQKIENYAASGATMANHGPRTTQVKLTEKKKWNLFVTSEMKDDPDTVLAKCDAPTFKAYLHWRVKNCRVKKESSLLTYWNNLSMAYADLTKGWMNDRVLYDIRQWVPQELTPEFNLDVSKKDKSGLYVDDLDIILKHLWVYDEAVMAHERLRVQLALILILAGATSTRPDALVGKVLYKHVEFQIFRPASDSPGALPRIGLVVNLEHLKGKPGNKMIFGFHEEDALLHDPVVHMLGLALADHAFFNDRITCYQSIYKMIVPPNADRIRLLWREEWRERPIFRDIGRSSYGKTMSPEKPLPYKKAREWLLQLGRATGYAKKLEFYDLRRGSGKRLNEALTPEERNKAMGHRLGDSSTFVRYYMADFISADCQAIIFGSEPQKDLVHRMSRLHRYGGAPTKLTPAQHDEVYHDPILVALREERSTSLTEIKKEFGTQKHAQGTALYAKYIKLRNTHKEKAKLLRQERLDQEIKQFHELSHAEEVDRQLNGQQPLVSVQPNVEYELPERREVAELVTRATAVTDRDELHQLRMQLSMALSRLCSRKESPCRSLQATSYRKPGAAHQKIHESPLSLSDSSSEESLSIPSTGPIMHKATSKRVNDSRYSYKMYICAFCRWGDAEVGPSQREAQFRIDALSRHFKIIHAKIVNSDTFDCPYKGCNAVFGESPYFPNWAQISFGNHICLVHDVPLQGSWNPTVMEESRKLRPLKRRKREEA